MIVDYKSLYFESEKERKDISKDYLSLAKKFVVVEKENESLKKENENLRKKINERKNNSEVVNKQAS